MQIWENDDSLRSEINEISGEVDDPVTRWIQNWRHTLHEFGGLQIKQFFILVKHVVLSVLFCGFLLEKIISYFENFVLEVKVAIYKSE